MNLNSKSRTILEAIAADPQNLNVSYSNVGKAHLIDFGVNCDGSADAGLRLAEVSTGGLANLQLNRHPHTEINYPAISFHTKQPLQACMAAQYAGWPFQHEDYFGMGSGPIRLLRGKEKLLSHYGMSETSEQGVLCLESSKLPAAANLEAIATEAGIQPEQLWVAVAPTSSIAGSVQVVARSVETALHKLHEIGFNLETILSGQGTAPLPPGGGTDLQAIGTTNDSILFGGQVELWVDTEPQIIEAIGPQTPSSVSEDFGKPFYQLFKENDFDFYKIDPLLFSPAKIVFHNSRDGKSSAFGAIHLDLLKTSFES